MNCTSSFIVSIPAESHGFLTSVLFPKRLQHSFSTACADRRTGIMDPSSIGGNLSQLLFFPSTSGRSKFLFCQAMDDAVFWSRGCPPEERRLFEGLRKIETTGWAFSLQSTLHFIDLFTHGMGELLHVQVHCRGSTRPLEVHLTHTQCTQD